MLCWHMQQVNTNTLYFYTVACIDSYMKEMTNYSPTVTVDSDQKTTSQELRTVHRGLARFVTLHCM